MVGRGGAKGLDEGKRGGFHGRCCRRCQCRSHQERGPMEYDRVNRIFHLGLVEVELGKEKLYVRLFSNVHVLFLHNLEGRKQLVGQGARDCQNSLASLCFEFLVLGDETYTVVSFSFQCFFVS